MPILAEVNGSGHEMQGKFRRSKAVRKGASLRQPIGTRDGVCLIETLVSILL